MGYLMYCSAFILWFDHFLDSRAEICQIFRWFFVKFKRSKEHSEINWPLDKKYPKFRLQSLLSVVICEKISAFLCFSSESRYHRGCEKIIQNMPDQKESERSKIAKHELAKMATR